MMEHYVTLFDSVFLPQGLALHESLESHSGEFTLWVLCMDLEVYKVLSEMKPNNMRLIKLDDVITPELQQVKVGRTRAEFCWTCTPFAPRFVFEIDPAVRRVTYLDADLWFIKNPSIIFNEFEVSGKQVLITHHGYTPEYDNSTAVGHFCVQFMTFLRDGSEGVRKWWEDRCIEWCYAFPEDGKLGDQKYLDDWPQRFSDEVHVLQHKEWTLAPWNAMRFPYGDAVLYHFHGLRLMNKDKVSIGGYILPPVLIQNIYRPYLISLKRVCLRLKDIGFEPKFQHKYPGLLSVLRRKLGSIYAQRWRFIPQYFMDL